MLNVHTRNIHKNFFKAAASLLLLSMLVLALPSARVLAASSNNSSNSNSSNNNTPNNKKSSGNSNNNNQKSNNNPGNNNTPNNNSPSNNNQPFTAGAPGTTSGISPGQLPTVQTNQNTLDTIKNVVFGILGSFALLGITLSGLKYVTSAGNPQKTSEAKNGIIYSLVGLVLAISANAIVTYVISKTGT